MVYAKKVVNKTKIYKKILFQFCYFKISNCCFPFFVIIYKIYLQYKKNHCSEYIVFREQAENISGEYGIV